MEEHLYIVAYDIRDEKRLRRVFKLMKGYGEWLQLSIFQCRLTRRRHAELIALLEGMIHRGDDHVILLDLGPAETIQPRVVSLGRAFEALQRAPIIV